MSKTTTLTGVASDCCAASVQRTTYPGSVLVEYQCTSCGELVIEQVKITGGKVYSNGKIS